MNNHDQVIELLGRIDERVKGLAERQEEACHRLRRIDDVLEDHGVWLVVLEKSHSANRWRWNQLAFFFINCALAVVSA